jgi:hypothetical protein
MKTKAEILNAIPPGMDLETYFDSLNIFEKRELIDELEICRSHFTKHFKQKVHLALISYTCSFVCFFGVGETWFLYYLVVINIPLSIFLFLDFKDAKFYQKAIKKMTSFL